MGDAEDAALNMKICKAFSISFLKRVLLQYMTINDNAETNEHDSMDASSISCLLAVIIDELQFGDKSKKIFKFLKSCGVNCPVVLTELSEKGISLKQKHWFDLLVGECHDGVDYQVFSRIIEGIETGIISMDSDVLFNKIAHLFNQLPNDSQLSVAIELCSQLEEKRECGRMLAFLTRHMHSSDEAVSFIFSVIREHFFPDLIGTQREFYESLDVYFQDLSENVKLFIAKNARTDNDGNIIESDSDADEQGNLSGFICDDEEEGSCPSSRDSVSSHASSPSDSENDSSPSGSENGSSDRINVGTEIRSSIKTDQNRISKRKEIGVFSSNPKRRLVKKEGTSAQKIPLKKSLHDDSDSDVIFD